MTIICHACGKTNPNTNTTCRSCGMTLLEDTGEETPAAATIQTPPPERTPRSTTLSDKSTRDADLQPAPSHDAETAKIGTTYYSSRIARDAPVSLAFTFPKVLVAGFPSNVYVEIKNLTSSAIEQVEVKLESLGLIDPAVERAQLAGGQTLRLLISLEPARAGLFVLQCTVKATAGELIHGYIGTRTLRINAAPRDPNQLLDLHNFISNHVASAFVEGSEPAPLTVAAIPGADSVRTLDDLLRFKLPDQLTPLILSLDYDVSISAVQQSTTLHARNLIIFQLFLGYAQAGTLLKLTPLEPGAARAIHLVARPQFRIGRSRDPANAADLITWFLPRNKRNDERTKHLGRVHFTAVRRDDGVYMWDNNSLAGTTFDGQSLPVTGGDQPPLTGGELLNRRAVLALGGEYFIDVQPMPSAYDGDPEIKNIKLWNGPQQPQPEVRGAIRFTSINSEPSHHDAVWLYTDATFGTSRSNSVVANIPGLSEIQGRFHHYRGCFWVENRVANESVRINTRAMFGNEIAPLISGLILQLGQVSFQVEVQA